MLVGQRQNQHCAPMQGLENKSWIDVGQMDGGNGVQSAGTEAGEDMKPVLSEHCYLIITLVSAFGNKRMLRILKYGGEG